MSNQTLGLDSQLYNYLLSSSLRELESLRQLRSQTASHQMAPMQIAPEQVVQLMEAKKTLEVSVFTDYSTLAVALALPPDGKIIACDVNQEDTEIARQYWQAAGVANMIDLRIAPALETLDRLLANGEAQTFDFAFIDADKENYQAYYERSLQLLRPGGLIAIALRCIVGAIFALPTIHRNVLWGGRVAKKEVDDRHTQAIRAFNHKLNQDERVQLSMVPIADGLTLALKRG